MQCRRVGRTDERLHTESEKNVSSSLQPGSANGSSVMHLLAVMGNLSHKSLCVRCGNDRCGNDIL